MTETTNPKYTVRKVHMGERYAEVDGKEYIWMTSTSWAIFNSDNKVIDFFYSKIAATQYAENILA